MTDVIDKELLEILRCPETKSPLRVLDDKELAKLNELVSAGGVKTASGAEQKSKVEAGLITEDGLRIYRIEDHIPIMLIDEAILTEELKGFARS